MKNQFKLLQTSDENGKASAVMVIMEFKEKIVRPERENLQALPAV